LIVVVVVVVVGGGGGVVVADVVDDDKNAKYFLYSLFHRFTFNVGSRIPIFLPFLFIHFFYIFIRTSGHNTRC